jgi:hypothetical protein
MIKPLEWAIAEVVRLPEETQEEIARQLLMYVEKWRTLRAAIEEGVRSLEEEGGKELDVEKFLMQMHRENPKP